MRYGAKLIKRKAECLLGCPLEMQGNGNLKKVLGSIQLEFRDLGQIAGRNPFYRSLRAYLPPSLTPMNVSNKRIVFALFCTTALSFAASIARPESTPEERATWRKAADNKIYAQKLVDELMASHPELLVVGLHGTAPGANEERMIASNLDRIGKKDDDDDVGVSTEHKTICAPNLKESFKFEVLMPLKDSSGAFLNGAVGFVFRYKQGDDEVKMHALAVQIRDGLAKKIPSMAALFKAQE